MSPHEGSPSEGADRRRHPRLAACCRVAYRTIREGSAAPRTNATETINLSASGLCMRAAEALEPDLHLALEIQLDDRPEPVMAIARVVWCDRDRAKGDYRLGLCFTWLREKDRQDLKVIAEYVEARIRDGEDA